MAPDSPPTGQAARRRLIGGSSRMMLAESLGLVCGLVIAGFLGRRLGPELFGLLMVATAVVVWLEAVISGLYSRAAIRFISGAEDWRPGGTTVLRLYLITSSAVMVLLLIMAHPIAAALDSPELANYLALFSIDIPIHALAQAHAGMLISTSAFSQRAYAIAGRWATKTVLIVVLIEMSLSIEGAILGTVGASLVELLIGRYFIRPKLFAPSTFMARTMAGFFVPTLFYALSMRLMARVDLVMLKWLGAATAAVGTYGAAQYLSRVPNLLGRSISSLLQSSLGQLRRQGAHEEARSMARDAMRVLLALFPLAAIAAGSSTDIMGLVFGYGQYSEAAPVFSLLIFASISRMMMNMNSAMLVTVDKPAWTYRIALPIFVITIFGYLLIIPRHGPLGAAAVTLAATVLGVLCMIVAVYRTWQVAPGVTTVMRTVLIGLIGYYLSYFWPARGPMLVVELLVLSLIVPVGYVFMGEYSVRQLRTACKSLRRDSAATDEEVYDA